MADKMPPDRHQQPMFVAIQGPTCSGKSALAEAVSRELGHTCVHIALDRFFLPFDRTTHRSALAHDFDSPDALDWAALLDFIEEVSSTRSATAPVFNYLTGLRNSYERIAECGLIILEGLWPFVNATLMKYVSLKVYVDAPPDIRLIRRLRRDVLRGERGFSLATALEYYETFTRPVEETVICAGRSMADLVLDGQHSLAENVHTVRVALEAAAQKSPSLPLLRANERQK